MKGKGGKDGSGEAVIVASLSLDQEAAERVVRDSASRRERLYAEFDNEMGAIIKKSKASSRRAVIVFASVVAFAFVLIAVFALWISNKEERECRDQGGEMRCTSSSGVVDGKPAFFSTCSCEVTK